MSDPFDLFDLEPRWQLDTGDLQDRYETLQRAVHPDRFAGADAREKRMAVEWAARVNDAYQALRRPLSRARVLLARLGVEPAEDESRADPEFLMEQMTLREEQESAESAGDRERLLAVDVKVRDRLDDEREAFAGAFCGADAEAAQRHYHRMQFLERQLETVAAVARRGVLH